MLLYFHPPPCCNFVSSDGWDCWGDVAGVTEVDLLLVAAEDDWGVVRFVLFDLARRRG
jgi:hypothetical protein